MFLSRSFVSIAHRLQWLSNPNKYAMKISRVFSHGYDPMARTPTEKCDPYGQGGKPMEYDKAIKLLQTLDQSWRVMDASSVSQSPSSYIQRNTNTSSVLCDSGQHTFPYLYLYREFYHDSFLDGSKFLNMIAAISQNHNHYPEISLQRRLIHSMKAWEIVTSVKCFTQTLAGLSHSDFLLALMIDVEATRPEYQKLLFVTNENKSDVSK